MTAVASFYASVTAALSAPRLGGYRAAPGDAEPDLIARYLWNIGLGAALYPSLHLLEVGLRNRLDTAISAREGRGWFDDPDVVVNAEEQEQVATAKKRLEQAKKVVTPDGVVAALDFGFWTALLSPAYEQGGSKFIPPGQPPLLLVATPKPLWPELLGAVSAGRSRRQLSGRMSRLRKLRNRVSHYEPIWQGIKGLAPLDILHGDLIDAIGWFDADLQRVAGLVDTFPLVYGGGPEWYRARVTLLTP